MGLDFLPGWDFVGPDSLPEWDFVGQDFWPEFEVFRELKVSIVVLH